MDGQKRSEVREGRQAAIYAAAAAIAVGAYQEGLKTIRDPAGLVTGENAAKIEDAIAPERIVDYARRLVDAVSVLAPDDGPGNAELSEDRDLAVRVAHDANARSWTLLYHFQPLIVQRALTAAGVTDLHSLVVVTGEKLMERGPGLGDYYLRKFCRMLEAVGLQIADQERWIGPPSQEAEERSQEGEEEDRSQESGAGSQEQRAAPVPALEPEGPNWTAERREEPMDRDAGKDRSQESDREAAETSEGSEGSARSSGD